MACQTNVTLLEVRSPGNNNAGWPEYSAQLNQICQRRNIACTPLGMSESTLYLALEKGVRASEPAFELDRRVEVHLRNNQSILALVGEGIHQANLVERVRALFASKEAVHLPSQEGSCVLRIAVPPEALATCLELFRHAFFSDLN